MRKRKKRTTSCWGGSIPPSTEYWQLY